MNQWIDFRELRSKLRFTDVLRLYRVELTQKGSQLVGPCPLPNHPKDDHSPSFSANAERGIFQCFRCKARGNLLDFAGLMEGIDLRNGAELRAVAAKLLGTLAQANERRRSEPEQMDSLSASAEKKVLVNEPLDFELKGLDTRHPWLLKSGLSPETIAYFDLGVAQRGYLKGRLAIPLHNLEGKLVGYAGRILDDSQISPENPKYLFPETRERNGVIHRFDPGEVLYNAHRDSGRIEHVVVTSEFEDAWRAQDRGMGTVVGLLGPECSPTQVSEIVRLSGSASRIDFFSPVAPSGVFWREVGRLRSIRWVESVRTGSADKRR